jgi:hypothetical protein
VGHLRFCIAAARPGLLVGAVQLVSPAHRFHVFAHCFLRFATPVRYRWLLGPFFVSHVVSLCVLDLFVSHFNFFLGGGGSFSDLRVADCCGLGIYFGREDLLACSSG